MKKVLTMLLGLSALALAAGVLYFAAVASWKQIGVLDPNVAAAIVAALAAAAGAIYTQRNTRAREIAESHREKKVELYNIYMDIIDMVMRLSREGRLGEITEGSLPPELEKLFHELRRGLLVWASPDVILAYGRFMVAGKKGVEVLQRADDMFRAIRKDLGNSNWGLAQGALIKLFLKDPAEYDRLIGGGPQSTGPAAAGSRRR